MSLLMPHKHLLLPSQNLLAQAISLQSSSINTCWTSRVSAGSISECVSHMAGIHLSLSNIFTCNWIVDSGASHHITPCEELLCDIKDLEKHLSDKVQVPTGGRSQIANACGTTIFGLSKMKNVLHVPDFEFNIISMSKITKDFSCVVLFFPDFCVFYGLYNVKVLGIDREKEGLYILQEKVNPQANVANSHRNTKCEL